MLTAKPWKLDALVRLLASVFLCIFAGSVLVAAVHYAGTGGRLQAKVFSLTAGALLLLGAALLLVHRPWTLETLARRFMTLMVLFYSGIFLGA